LYLFLGVRFTDKYIVVSTVTSIIYVYSRENYKLLRRFYLCTEHFNALDVCGNTLVAGGRGVLAFPSVCFSRSGEVEIYDLATGRFEGRAVDFKMDFRTTFQKKKGTTACTWGITAQNG
jgi:hypothetical protein